MASGEEVKEAVKMLQAELDATAGAAGKILAEFSCQFKSSLGGCLDGGCIPQKNNTCCATCDRQGCGYRCEQSKGAK